MTVTQTEPNSQARVTSPIARRSDAPDSAASIPLVEKSAAGEKFSRAGSGASAGGNGEQFGRGSAQAVVISRRVNDKVTGRRAARGVYGSYRYRHQAGPTAMALARTRWMQKLSGNQ